MLFAWSWMFETKKKKKIRWEEKKPKKASQFT